MGRWNPVRVISADPGVDLGTVVALSGGGGWMLPMGARLDLIFSSSRSFAPRSSLGLGLLPVAVGGVWSRGTGFTAGAVKAMAYAYLGRRS